MAKKKDKKGTSFLQSTYDIATAGVNTKSGSWTDKAYDAAGGGNYGNAGPQNTGYSIDWSKVDFGKSSLESVMNQTEATAKRTEINKLKRDCAESGGLWNPTLGRCEDKREKKEPKKDDTKKKKCYCDGVYVGEIDPTAKCEDEHPCDEENPDPNKKMVDCGCGGQEKTVEDCKKRCSGDKTDGGTTECNCPDGKPVGIAYPGEKCEEKFKEQLENCSETPGPDPKRDCAEGEYWDEAKGECVKKSTTDIPDKKDVKKKDLEFSNQDDVNKFNESFGTQTLNKDQQKELNESYFQDNVNSSVGGLDGLKGGDNNSISISLGGGNIDRGKTWNGNVKNPVETTFDKKGNVTGFKNKGEVKSRNNYGSKTTSFNYSFEFKTNKNNNKKTIKFEKLNSRATEVFKHFGFQKTKKLEMTASQWKDFRVMYEQTLKKAQDKLKKLQKQGLKDTDLYSEWYSSYGDSAADMYEARIASEVLKMNARGFFSGDFSGEDTPVNFKSQYDYTQPIPVQFKSPFPRRNRSRLKVRENWTPTQSPMNHGSLEDFQYGRRGHNPDTMSAKHEDWHLHQSRSPGFKYNTTPLHQQEQDVSQMQFGSIWEKIQGYGPDMDKKIDKFIKHTNYDAEADKPINSFQNQEWVGIITKWLQEQKAAMIKANKNNDEKQRISTAVNTLIQDVTTYSGKFLDWIARNAGDETEGNAGGSVVSQGSKKDERFIGNITFMGDKNTTIGIGEDGKIGIKSFGLPTVKYVEELDTDVFAKDDMGYAQFLKISEELQKLAESGKPLNENTVKGNADQLLKNEDSVLSWAFDPLYGQSWLQDYLEVDPGVDVDQFMPESPKFDLDRLTDEIHGWLTSKMKEAYNQNIPQQPQQKGDAAQGIMDQTLAGVEQEKQNKEGVYADSRQQGPPQGSPPQGPPPQGPPQQSPMTYKKQKEKRKALALAYIKKFSKNK